MKASCMHPFIQAMINAPHTCLTEDLYKTSVILNGRRVKVWGCRMCNEYHHRNNGITWVKVRKIKRVGRGG